MTKSEPLMRKSHKSHKSLKSKKKAHSMPNIKIKLNKTKSRSKSRLSGYEVSKVSQKYLDTLE